MNGSESHEQVKIENVSELNQEQNGSPPSSPPLLYLKPRPKAPKINPTDCLITRTGLNAMYDEYVKPYIDKEETNPWNGDYQPYLEKVPGHHEIVNDGTLHSLLYHNPSLNVEVKPLNKYRLSNVFNFEEGILKHFNPDNLADFDYRQNTIYRMSNILPEDQLGQQNDITRLPKAEYGINGAMSSSNNGQRAHTPIDPTSRPPSEAKSHRSTHSDISGSKHRPSSQQSSRHHTSSNHSNIPQERRPHSSQSTREESERSRHSHHPDEHSKSKSNPAQDPNMLKPQKRSSSHHKRSGPNSPFNPHSPNVKTETPPPKMLRDENVRINNPSRDPSHQRSDSHSLSNRPKDPNRKQRVEDHHSKSIPTTSVSTPVDSNRSHTRHAHSSSGTPSRHPEGSDKVRHSNPDHSSSKHSSQKHHESNPSKHDADYQASHKSHSRQESKSSSKHLSVEDRGYDHQVKKSRSSHGTPEASGSYRQPSHSDTADHRSSRTHAQDRHSSSREHRHRDPNRNHQALSDPRMQKRKQDVGSEAREYGEYYEERRDRTQSSRH